jgi:hypothetical protein
MVKIKCKKQLQLPGMEEWKMQYSAQKLNRLESSWAGVFRTLVLPKLPVQKLNVFYVSGQGRPTKELYSLMGAVVLQQFFDLTDEEAVSELAFNQQWHFALECFNEEDQVISLKTLWTMRNQIVQLKIGTEIFEKATDNLIKYFKVNTDKQRLDSVHVYSNMARLGRIRIAAKTIISFLNDLKRLHMDLYQSWIPEELDHVYFSDKSVSYFGQIKPSETEKTLQSLAEQMNELLFLFQDNKTVSVLASYKTLQRVFSEQCLVKDDRIEVKSAKDIESSSLQNPSDPDAGYDGHKGQGYQTQIAETYSVKESDASEKQKDKPLNLITYVNTESADKHDSQALEPALENLKEREIQSSEILADSAYGRETNITKAEEYQVTLIAPVPGRTSGRGLESFTIDFDNFHILACPANQKPQKINTGKNSRFCAKWSLSVCDKCALAETCPTEKDKNNRKLYYTKGELTALSRRIYEQSDEFREKYRYRSGIEGTNSRFISMTGARRSRYRGIEKMSFSQALKALAINVFRSARSVELAF